MTQRPGGSVRILRVAGISVYAHWSWIVVAYLAIQIRGSRPGGYEAFAWNAAEYVALFAIVLLHEFGHALACRSVGGQAEKILLWPLGGIAYVTPPPRPGAHLWSIAAGPLVNVALVPISLAAYALAASHLGAENDPVRFLLALALINGVLLVFNILPIFPLDGGQMLYATLWYLVGQATALQTASLIGLVLGGGLALVGVLSGDPWLAFLAVYLGLRAYGGFRTGQRLAQHVAALRHLGLACPACDEPPPMGSFWKCGGCGRAFDTFEAGATCPGCGASFPDTQCPSCGARGPLADWATLADEA